MSKKGMKVATNADPTALTTDHLRTAEAQRYERHVAAAAAGRARAGRGVCLQLWACTAPVGDKEGGRRVWRQGAHHILNSDSRRSNPFDSESPVGSSGLAAHGAGLSHCPRKITAGHRKTSRGQRSREDRENGREDSAAHPPVDVRLRRQEANEQVQQVDPQGVRHDVEPRDRVHAYRIQEAHHSSASPSGPAVRCALVQEELQLLVEVRLHLLDRVRGLILHPVHGCVLSCLLSPSHPELCPPPRPPCVLRRVMMPHARTLRIIGA